MTRASTLIFKKCLREIRSGDLHTVFSSATSSVFRKQWRGRIFPFKAGDHRPRERRVKVLHTLNHWKWKLRTLDFCQLRSLTWVLQIVQKKGKISPLLTFSSPLWINHHSLLWSQDSALGSLSNKQQCFGMMIAVLGLWWAWDYVNNCKLVTLSLWSAWDNTCTCY